METTFGDKLICNMAYFAECKSAETQNSLPGQGEEVGSIPTYGTNTLLAQLVEQLTLNQWVRGSNPRGGTEAVVKWLNTVEESESATMDEPTILTSARRGKSRGSESRLPMQYGKCGRVA